MSGKTQHIFAKEGPLDKAMLVYATRVWTHDDSRSVIRLAPDAFQRRMAEIPDDVKNLGEADLRKRIRPTPTDNQLRISFWLEYDRVQTQMLPKMETVMIIRGIVAEDYFYTHYIKNLDRLAWMLIPPKSYTVRLSEGLDAGLDQLRETLELPHIENGKVNTKLLELKLKITAMFDLRMNGAIAQKFQIEQTSMNMNLAVNRTADEVNGYIESRNMEDIDKKLALLRRKDRMMSEGVHPDKPEIEVQSEVAEATDDNTTDQS